MNNISEFIKLAEHAREIANSSVSWETKYDMIFSTFVIGKMRKTGVKFDWYDPDQSYEDDVMALVNAVNEKADELRGSKSLQLKTLLDEKREKLQDIRRQISLMQDWEHALEEEIDALRESWIEAETE